MARGTAPHHHDVEQQNMMVGEWKKTMTRGTAPHRHVGERKNKMTRSKSSSLCSKKVMYLYACRLSRHVVASHMWWWWSWGAMAEGWRWQGAMVMAMAEAECNGGGVE
jgi:hypothetical protein